MLLDTLRVLQDLSLIWPCFAFAVVVSVIGIYIRWYISPNRKVAVECWFCQTKTKVPRAYCNDWMCSECKQYNGFNNDGDYRKPVPGQMSNGTASRFCRSNQTVENFSSHSNVFCRSCAANQQLKVSSEVFDLIASPKFSLDLLMIVLRAFLYRRITAVKFPAGAARCWGR